MSWASRIAYFLFAVVAGAVAMQFVAGRDSAGNFVRSSLAMIRGEYQDDWVKRLRAEADRASGTESIALRAQPAGTIFRPEGTSSESSVGEQAGPRDSALADADELNSIRDEMKIAEGEGSLAGSSKSLLEMQQDKLILEILKHRGRVRELERRLEKEAAARDEEKKNSDKEREENVRLVDLKEKLQAAVSSLKDQVARDGQENARLAAEVRSLRDELEKVAANREAQAEVTRLSGELTSIREELGKREKETADARTQLQQVREEKRVIEGELQQQRATSDSIGQLRREVASLKSELLMKQAEIELIQNPKARAKPVQETRAPTMTAAGRNIESASAARAMMENPQQKSDVLVVEVKVEKANLRTGAGEEHSPVMQVRRGARLTVESRQGDWYRVFTPTGSRAFVRVDCTRPYRENALPLSAEESSLPLSGQSSPPLVPEQPPLRVGAGADFEPWEGGARPGQADPGQGGVDALAVERLRQGLNRAANP